MVTVTHSKVLTIANDPTAVNKGEVVPTDWNASHVITGTTVRTYYVSPSGFDTNDGSSDANAFKTIAKINSLTLFPGDVVLFKGGQTFTDATLTPGQSGLPGAPITFGSYGTGPATLSLTAASGISWSNLSNIVIRDLIITGSGGTNQSGVVATYSVTSENVTLQNLTVSGFPSSGIKISASGSAILYGAQILNCTSHDNTATDTAINATGIYILGAYAAQSTGVYNIQNALIQDCVAYNNNGNATADVTSWSGSGIAIGEGLNCAIVRCLAHNNGGTSSHSDPVGIWFFDSKQCTISDCISHDNGGICDGFDLDGGTLNCTIEHCHAYNNNGGGIIVFCYNDGQVTSSDSNIVRGCYATNNGLNSSDEGDLWADAGAGATLTNLTFAGNTAVASHSPVAAITISGNNAKTTALVSGNTFVANVTGAACAHIRNGFSGTSIDFEGNNYWSSFSNPFKLNSTNYGDVGTWAVAATVEQRGQLSSPIVQSLSLDPTTSNIVSGDWSMLENSNFSFVAPWWNNAGTIQQIARYKLTANTNFYVATTGNDSNPGTSGSPWLTLTHAAQYIASNIDLAGFTITVNIGTGSFAGCGMRSTDGGGIIIWLGNGSSNTTITSGPNDGIYNFGECFDVNVAFDSTLFFNKMKIKPPDAFFAGIACYVSGVLLNVGDITGAGSLFDFAVDFTGSSGAAASIASIQAQSLINFFGNTNLATIAVTGGGASIFALLWMQAGGQCAFINKVTLTVTGSLTLASFGGAAVAINGGGILIPTQSGSTSWTGGSVTGPRYQITTFGGVSSGGGAGTFGNSFFCGNADGIVDSSSFYDGFMGHTAGAGLPSTSTFPDHGTGGLYKDTSGGGAYIVYNDAGTIKKATLT